LYIRNKKAITDLVEKLSNILQNIPNIKDDMELLGVALNQGQIQELPSLPSHAWHYKNTKYIFDGAAYGQYIFGQDPFHTNGKITSGYKNPNFEFDAEDANWRIGELEGRDTLSLDFQGNTYVLSNLHIHSKLLLDAISQESEIWKKYIHQANREAKRTPVEELEPSIHSEKLSIFTRIMVARKKGLLKTASRKAKRIINTEK
jgi:hypothetical protein